MREAPRQSEVNEPVDEVLEAMLDEALGVREAEVPVDLSQRVMEATREPLAALGGERGWIQVATKLRVDYASLWWPLAAAVVMVVSVTVLMLVNREQAGRELSAQDWVQLDQSLATLTAESMSKEGLDEEILLMQANLEQAHAEGQGLMHTSSWSDDFELSEEIFNDTF